MSNNLDNITGKKAQVGQTMTWTVATIVIFFILIFFVFISGFRGFWNVIGAGSSLSDRGSAAINQQTLFAILAFDNSKIKNLIESENFDEAQQKAEIILADFKKKGLACNLEIFVPIFQPMGFSDRYRVYTGKSFQVPSYAPAVIKINNIDIKLDCWTE